LSFIFRVLRGSIADESELFRYIAVITTVCVGMALAVDVANQLIFFVDWPTCFRSWTITTVLVLVLAVPISRTIGKAHLELYRAKLTAEELGRTDQLTGLPNRRALIESVDAKGFETLALVIVDIDWFKRVNDSHGHLVGDRVIRSVGQSMATALGAIGMVARVGGEEFALLSSGTSADAVAAALNHFRDELSSTPIVIGGLAIRVTISAGVAVGRKGDSFEQVYSEADRALYAAKRAGRNRVCILPGTGSLDKPYFDRKGDLNPDPSRWSA
jgi:diguanylate cyclase (GGDEF)-like protein